MNQLELTQIIAQASSLSERLSHGLLNIDVAQTNEQQIERSLDHWCQVVAHGDWEKLQQRLKWDGLDLDTVRPLLGSTPIVDSQALPKWAKTLTEIIETASNYTFQDNIQDSDKTEYKRSDRSNHPDLTLPFEDVLLPVLLVARENLLTLLESAAFTDYNPIELLFEEAYKSLERSLLQKLVNLCAQTLEFEFSNFRPFGQSFLTFLAGETQEGSKSKFFYHAFVQKLLQDGLLAFFQKYPVLGRLVATTVDFWVEATAEFLQRLQADLPELQQVFNYSTDVKKQLEKDKVTFTPRLGKIVEIKSFLSDPHNQGRSVIACTFESGQKLVYKPKNIESEVIYNQFLEWSNQHNILLPFKIYKVINRGNYGWAEYVEQLACEDSVAAQRFYQRAGMLVCIMYALGGNDCIYENLIASGEHPVLIDMEAIMYHEAHPISDFLKATESHDVASQHFWDSVVRSGLLPRWHFNKDDRIAFDVSALGSVESQQAPWTQPRWKSVNTDNMHLVSETVTIPFDKNVPILNGAALSPNDYLDELVGGFRQMYRLLMEQREVLLAAGSPLTAMHARWVRFTFRQTRVYTILLKRLLAPQFLQNGVDRSIELDILSRAFLVNQDKPTAWPILQAEINAMEQLDVPYFGARTNSDALTFGLEQPVEQYFKEPSYSQVIDRVQNLNETDLAQQISIIQGSFYAKIARVQKNEQLSIPNSLEVRATDYEAIDSLTSEQLLFQAQAIAEEIHSTALRAADRSFYWIDLGYIRDAQRFQLQPSGYSFYDGNCGIVLFLTALDYIRGSTQFSNISLNALQPLRRVLQASDANSAQNFARQIGIGGAKGLGSIIYSLVKISKFLGDKTLLGDAQLAANLIMPELIAADRELHLMGGAAGAILGLLTLYRETGEPTVLETAVSCGQHLLKYRCGFDGVPKAWKTTLAEQPLTGLSCGAAGIAYALLKLYAVTNDRAYLEAAQAGIAYERSVFSTKAANWPDFRCFTKENGQPVVSKSGYFGGQNGQPGFNVSWCHGAAGIGLARLGGLSILETEEIDRDVEVAIHTTQKYSLQDLDSLCYGNFGRIELLLVAAQKLSRSHLRETALKQASWAIAKTAQTGAYQMLHNLPTHTFSPGFFQGTSGIGYELLRLAYPELLPSVLLWE
jgi:type 2 lantibiotic biosynthesis protein LanM